MTFQPATIHEPAPAGEAPVNQATIEAFHEHGFVVLRNFFDVARDLAPIADQIAWLGQRIGGDGFAMADAAAIERLSLEQRGTLYRSLRYLPALAQLAARPGLLDLSRAFGIAFPLVLRSFNVRMDTPHRDEFLFHWHQDITYLLGSHNSLTYWIPLSQVDAEHGSIEVVDASHRDGIRALEYTGAKALEPQTVLSPADARLVKEPDDPTIPVEAEPGDLVAFSQYLLHRSTPNRSSGIRWTVQIRHADADEQAFLDAGLPMGDATNIFFHDAYYGFQGER